MSDNCQGCKRKFKVYLIIPDKLWRKIQPAGTSKGKGLLCGMCIMKRLESLNKPNLFLFTVDSNN